MEKIIDRIIEFETWAKANGFRVRLLENGRNYRSQPTWAAMRAWNYLKSKENSIVKK